MTHYSGRQLCLLSFIARHVQICSLFLIFDNSYRTFRNVKLKGLKLISQTALWEALRRKWRHNHKTCLSTSSQNPYLNKWLKEMPFVMFLVLFWHSLLPTYLFSLAECTKWKSSRLAGLSDLALNRVGFCASSREARLTRKWTKSP